MPRFSDGLPIKSVSVTGFTFQLEFVTVWILSFGFIRRQLLQEKLLPWLLLSVCNIYNKILSFIQYLLPNILSLTAEVSRVSNFRVKKQVRILYKVLYRENSKTRFLWHCDNWKIDRISWLRYTWFEPWFQFSGVCWCLHLNFYA